jgi:hypothetical protein
MVNKPELYRTQDANGYRKFDYVGRGTVLLVRNSAVQLVQVLDTEYGADGNVYSSSFPNVTASIELELVTEIFTPGTFPNGSLSPARMVWVANIQKYYYNQSWTLVNDFTEQTAFRIGAFPSGYVPLADVGVVRSGTGNSTLTFSVTYPELAGYNLITPTCAFKLRIFGGGRFVVP